METEHEVKTTSRLTWPEAILVGVVWVIAGITIWLLTVNYHADQAVSLENAIAYIVLGAVLISAAVLFIEQLRDVITQYFQKKSSENE